MECFLPCSKWKFNVKDVNGCPIPLPFIIIIIIIIINLSYHYFMRNLIWVNIWYAIIKIFHVIFFVKSNSVRKLKYVITLLMNCHNVTCLDIISKFFLHYSLEGSKIRTNSNTSDRETFWVPWQVSKCVKRADNANRHVVTEAAGFIKLVIRILCHVRKLSAKFS